MLVKDMFTYGTARAPLPTRPDRGRADAWERTQAAEWGITMKG